MEHLTQWERFIYAVGMLVVYVGSMMGGGYLIVVLLKYARATKIIQLRNNRLTMENANLYIENKNLRVEKVELQQENKRLSEGWAETFDIPK